MLETVKKASYWKNATFNVNIAPPPISSPSAAFAAGLARCHNKQGFEYLRSVAKR
jgi:protein-disulfide isomerase